MKIHVELSACVQFNKKSISIQTSLLNIWCSGKMQWGSLQKQFLIISSTVFECNTLHHTYFQNAIPTGSYGFLPAKSILDQLMLC